MVLQTRHLKIGFDGNLVLEQIKAKEEDLDITGLFNFVVRGMQFSYDYVVDKSGDWVRLPNGTWTGIAGLLNRSEVDYAPAMFILTGEESDTFAYYNYPYKNDELIFITRKTEYSPEIMALFRTLSLNVWLSLLACIILVTLVCFVVLKHRCTLDDILLHVLAIGLNQEGNLVPNRAGEIMLLGTWTGAMAVFTFCFKSVLLSFLTFPPLSGVRTVPELAAAIRTGQYIAFTTDGNDFPSDLQSSPIEDFRVIGESMLKNPRGNMEDVFYQSPKYPIKALVFLRSYTSFFDGMLYVSKDNMRTVNFVTAVNKNFCCKEEMDMLVHRYKAAGIDQKINRLRDYKNMFIAHSIYSSHLPVDEKTKKITMTDLSGVFILLVAGHCLSFCLLIIECCVKRRERRRSSTRKK